MLLMFVLFLSTFMTCVFMLSEANSPTTNTFTKVCMWISTFTIFCAAIYTGGRLFIWTFNLPI